MPKITGLPITVTAGQPQRETSHFNVSVSYDTLGAATFNFNAFGIVRLRATDGTIVYEEAQKQFVTLSDAQLPLPVKTAFQAIVAKLDLI